MPKQHRLSRADHKLIAAARLRRERGVYFALSYGVIPDAKASPRIACVVSKKSAPRAVDRNRIKRNCRAAARGLIASAVPGAVFVFHAGRNAREAPSSDIKTDIADLVRKSLAQMSA